MQASQIDPAKIYALRVVVHGTASTESRSYIARFTVSMVVSNMARRKLKPSSADYTHFVHGRIDQRDVPPELLPEAAEEREKYLKRTVDPAEIEDEYHRFNQLKEREKAEKTKADAEKAERLKNAQQLVDLFYQFTGLAPIPKEGYQDKSPFKADDYYGSVIINQEGCIALFKVLTPNQPVVDK